MLTNDQLRFIAEGCEDMELDAIWDFFEHPHGTRRLKHDYASFSDRRDAFLWVLTRLLEEGRIKLIQTKTHHPMGGTIEEQVAAFRRSFPTSDLNMNGGLWFLTDACPGGSAWQHSGD